MSLYHIAFVSAAGNFIVAALMQSLPNAIIGVAVSAALIWSKP